MSAEKCMFEITTGMYSEPLVTEGTYERLPDGARYTWTEIHSEGEIPSDFELVINTEAHTVKVVRGGDVGSVMLFDANAPTKGSLNTVYGVIEVGIVTLYINMPSVLSPVLEISYELDSGADEPVRNLFAIKRTDDIV